jgi:hypothetical protein
VTRAASGRQCRGCGIRLPAWMSDEYGSLTPSADRMRVLKFFRVGEHGKLDFVVELFNLLNH